MQANMILYDQKFDGNIKVIAVGYYKSTLILNCYKVHNTPDKKIIRLF